MQQHQVTKRVEEEIMDQYIEGLAKQMMESPEVSLSTFLTANKDDRLDIIEEQLENNDLFDFD